MIIGTHCCFWELFKGKVYIFVEEKWREAAIDSRGVLDSGFRKHCECTGYPFLVTEVSSDKSYMLGVRWPNFPVFKWNVL